MKIQKAFKLLGQMGMMGFSALFCGSAFASTVFTCQSVNPYIGQAVSLALVQHDTIKVDEEFATVDLSYSPRLNQGFLRYNLQGSQPASRSVLIEEPLMYGAKNEGYIKIEIREGGFYSTTFYCHL